MEKQQNKRRQLPTKKVKILKDKKIIFPSYSQLKQSIVAGYQQKCTLKIDQYDTKIENFKSKIDVKNQHHKLLNKILDSSISKNNIYHFGSVQSGEQQLTRNQYHQIFLEQLSDIKKNCNKTKFHHNTASLKQKKQNLQFSKINLNAEIKQKKQKMQGRYKNVESLNQYLENNSEQQDNQGKSKHKFEAYLKFRKKALLRQLESEQNTECQHEDKQNQGMYRNLFMSKNNGNLGSSRSKNKNNHKTKLHKNAENQLGDKFSEGEEMRQNKAKLNELYKPFMNALSHTNLVKWRILNLNNA